MKKFLLGCILVAIFGPAIGRTGPGRPASTLSHSCPAGDDSTLFQQMIRDYFDGVADKDFVKQRSMTADIFMFLLSIPVLLFGLLMLSMWVG